MTETFAALDDLGEPRASDLSSSLTERLGAQAGEAFMGGTRALYRLGEYRAAEAAPRGDLDEFSARMYHGTGHPEQPAAEVPIADAKERIKQEGLEHHLKLPEQESIKAPVLDLMIAHAHERREYENTVSRGPQGFLPDALGFLTSVGAGIIDPVNVAAFSIPVVGEARFGAMLASAGESLLARGGVRAGVGAAQGAVGGAAMVPTDWWLHTLDGQDYTMADALHSVVMSAGMGAAFHAGFGALGDVRARARGLPLPGSPEDQALRALLGTTRIPETAGIEESPTGADAVHADVLAQLRASGMSEEAAQANATVVAARYAARAQRLGMADPFELYSGEGLSIRRGGELAPEEGERAYAQRQRKTGEPDLFAEREAEGQLQLPGAERIGQGEQAQRRANEPLKPKVAQKPMDEGLFGDEAKQKSFFQGEHQAPPFYSAVARAVTEARQEKASPEQWLGMLKNRAGVKPEELQWLGLEEWLKSQKGPVSKQAIADYVRANSIEVREITKAEPSVENARAGLDLHAKFGRYTLEGGRNYRELLLTLPVDTEKFDALERARGEAGANAAFMSSHMDEPNTLAWVRFNDRTIDGKKTLFLEEIQSDWHQKGRERGYKTARPEADIDRDLAAVRTEMKRRVPDLDEMSAESWQAAWDKHPDLDARYRDLIQESGSRSIGVPDAPFKTTWPELALKRMLRYAAEHGYEKVAWTTGEIQAARYDLSKQISRVRVYGEGDDLRVSAWDKSDRSVMDLRSATETTLSDIIGKEAADRILSKPRTKTGRSDGFRELSGLDLKVGGEGMAGFYDKMLPAAAGKLTKKFGSKVREAQLHAERARGLQIEPQGDEWVVYDPRRPDEVEHTFDTEREAERFAESEATKPDRRDTVHTLDVTPALREAALKEGFPLFQGGKEGGPRGRITLGEGKAVVDLFAKADRSTFMHEMGHLWLDELTRDAARDNVPQALKDDLGTVLRWLGVEKADDITTEHHEQFARGFEAYLAEGRAPSTKLAAAFEKFKQWLITIYKSLAGIDSLLSDDVRGVFDRMLATDTEIAARPHPAEVLADLPPRVREDVTRAAVADVVNGNAVRAGEMLREAGKEDPRIAESLAPLRSLLKMLSPEETPTPSLSPQGGGETGAVIKTGRPQTDAILDDPAVRAAIEHPKINRGNDVPYEAGASEGEDTTTNIDKRLPAEAVLDNGQKFPPDVPANIHEQVEKASMERRIAAFKEQHGREPNTKEMEAIYEAAHHEDAEPAEDAWYRAQGIDIDAANRWWAAQDKVTEHENPTNPPPNLYKKPYPHNKVEGVKHEEPGAAAEWPEGSGETPTPSPSPPQVGPARLAHSDVEPGQAQVQVGGEQTEAGAPVVHIKPKAARGPRARDPDTWSLFEFLASRGGIDPADAQISDVRTILGRDNRFVPGFGNLIRKGGMRLDQAREAAVEAGYLFDIGHVTAAARETTINSLLEAMENEERGKRVYKAGVEPTKSKAELEHAQERDLHRADGALDLALERVEIDPKTVTGDLRDRILEIMLKEGVHDPIDAYERAAMEETQHGAEAGEHERIAETIPGWDVPDDAGAAPGAGAAASGGGERGPGGAPRQPGQADRGAGRAAERADWRRVAEARRADDGDLVEASREAEKAPEPPSTDPAKAPGAAEQAAKEADELLNDILPRLTEEEKAIFQDALDKLEADKTQREQLIRDGAECLLGAIA